MKKILILALFVMGCGQLFAQKVKAKPNKSIKIKGFERTVGKRLNSPSNYYGYRPLYNDTLYINLEHGQRIEIIYDWFDLFRCDEKAYNDLFWLPFDAKFNLLKEKTNDLILNTNTKYHICLKSGRSIRSHRINNAQYYNNDSLYINELEKGIAKFKDAYVGKTKAERDSIGRVALHKFYREQYPNRSVISVVERKNNKAHREYRLEGKRIVGQAQWQHILEIAHKDWNVRFYVNDLNDFEAIDSLDLNNFIRSERENFIRNRYYQYHTCLNYTLIDGQLMYQYKRGEKRKKRTRYIDISWTPIVGTSLLKSKWSADLGAQIGLSFNDKQQWANRLSLRYQLKGIGEGDVDGGSSMRYNGFVDGMLDLNLAEDYKREQWVGAGIGYLVHQEGSTYGKNTARIFLKYRSSQLWGVQPEFNYSFKDKEGFVGIGFFFSL